jgi:hypothetical protein
MRCSLFCTSQHSSFIHQMSTKLCAAPSLFCTSQHNNFIHQVSTRLCAAPSLFCTSQHNTFIHQMSTKLCAAPYSAVHYSTTLSSTKCQPNYALLLVLHVTAQHFYPPKSTRLRAAPCGAPFTSCRRTCSTVSTLCCCSDPPAIDTSDSHYTGNGHYTVMVTYYTGNGHLLYR